MADPFWFKAGVRAVRSVGYTAAAPLVLTLAPAGHAPGYYEINQVVVLRTLATGGALARVFDYSTPTVGAAQLNVGSTNLTGFGGPIPAATFSAYSDGANAMTLTFNPSSVTGSPVVDITALATFIAP